MAGTPALPSEQSEGQRLGGGEQLSDEPRARFRGAVVSGWRISVESFRVEFLLFLQGEDLWLSTGFLRGWEPPPYLTGNDQMTDNPCLITCSGHGGWQLRVRTPLEDGAWT